MSSFPKDSGDPPCTEGCLFEAVAVEGAPCNGIGPLGIMATDVPADSAGCFATGEALAGCFPNDSLCPRRLG